MHAKKAAENNKTNKSEQYVSFEEGYARAKAKRTAAEKFKSGYISFEEGFAMRARAARAANAAAEELENDDKYESFADRCIRLGQAILVE